MSTKPAKKPASKYAALDKAAEELRALRGAKKKAPTKPAKAPKSEAKPRTPPAKKKASNGQITTLKPISEEALGDIVRNRVKFSDDHTSLVIDAETPFEEYLHIFDYTATTADKSQWLLGAVVNQGQAIYGTTYAEMMAKFGRPISTLKKYAAAERAISPELRALHPALKFTHCETVVKLREGDREKILKDAAQKAKDGHPLTVKELKVIADKKKPKRAGKTPAAKKPKHGKDKPDLALSTAEVEVYDELENTAAKLEREIEGASFILEMSSTQTATLREKLERIARFLTQIS